MNKINQPTRTGSFWVFIAMKMRSIGGAAIALRDPAGETSKLNDF
jgi:hypothetical protein